MICSKCGIDKIIEEFSIRENGNLRKQCKKCKYEVEISYRSINKERYLLHRLHFKQNNPDYFVSWYQQNKKQLLLKREKYQKDRRNYDINYRLMQNLRSRLNSAIKNDQKIGSAIKDLGCSIDELKVHLESLFQPGMTWDNYGRKGWHIDHIKPLSSYDLINIEQFKKACHYSNLQPLWAQDNLNKGAKIL